MSAEMIARLSEALVRFSVPSGPVPARELLDALADPRAREQFLRELRLDVWQRSGGRIQLFAAAPQEFPAVPKDPNAVLLRLVGSRRVVVLPADPALDYYD